MPQNEGMETTTTFPNDPLPLNLAARCLRVPMHWLRDEVKAGRLPGLRAGRVILSHVPTVAELLAQRAAESDGKGVADDRG